MDKNSPIKEFLLRNINNPSFGLNIQNEDNSFKYQLWFYLPPSKLSFDNTVIYTVGLSQHYFDSPCQQIELSFQVPGKHARQQLEKLGMILGELIFNTLKVTHFTPNLLLTGLKRLFMPEMNNIIVLDGAGLRPLWIEVGQNQHIRILHLLPVYGEEISLIRQMGVWNTYRNFIEQKINFFEPNRKPLTKVKYFTDEHRLAREVSIYQQPLNEIQLSQLIVQWYIHNAPEIPASNASQLPLKIENLEKYFGIDCHDIISKPSSEVNLPKTLNELWERLYSGFYQYRKGQGLIPDLHFTPEGAINIKT